MKRNRLTVICLLGIISCGPLTWLLRTGGGRQEPFPTPRSNETFARRVYDRLDFRESVAIDLISVGNNELGSGPIVGIGNVRHQVLSFH